jgi:hypothetical protein
VRLKQVVVNLFTTGYNLALTAGGEPATGIETTGLIESGPRHHFFPFPSAVHSRGQGQSGLFGLGLSSGYASRAAWLSGLKAADLAGKGKGLFTSASLDADLNGVAPHGVNIQHTGSAPDFIALIQSHQAWIAKNFPGFYSWQHKVEQQVQSSHESIHGAFPRTLFLV